ncbi:MAG: Txe/YoeB family addiction module toxin [Saprospiraceae bacterium]|nr:Txe/YoeB family addiction module toxin [Saprospiraceae bacterium]
MAKFRIIVKTTAKNDFLEILKSGDKASIKKLEKILIELSVHPYSGIGNPELLKYDLSGFWSRRINNKNRLIYQIIEGETNEVIIVSALGHYE